MAISAADRELNRRLREEIGPQLSAADRRSIAREFGVDLRTVQRWFTSSGQQRAFIGRGQEDRREWAEIVLNGWHAGQGERTLDHHFGTIGEAEAFALDAKNGRISSFLDEFGRSALVYKEGREWVVEISYDPYPRRRRRR